jgi:hypothetical protein
MVEAFLVLRIFCALALREKLDPANRAGGTKMLKKLSCGLAALTMVGVAGAANAGVITTFSNRASFDAAVGSTTLEDFLPSAHYPINSGVLNQFTNEAGINPGDIQPGVTYSTPVGSGVFFNIDAGGGYTGGMLDSIRSTGTRSLTVTFDAPLAAFGFDTNQLMGSSFDITINFSSDGPSSTSHAVANSLGMEFFGFQSDQSDITSAVIQGNSSTFNYILDNFSFGGIASQGVPEPATLALFGLGLLGLGAARQKYKSA